jgi:hypothetical protein
MTPTDIDPPGAQGLGEKEIDNASSHGFVVASAYQRVRARG